MARPFRIGATGGPGLLLQAGPITPTRRRDVPLSKCRWLVSVDDVLQRHGTPSQTGPGSTPVAIQDQQSSGGSLREVSMVGGTRLPVESLGAKRTRSVLGQTVFVGYEVELRRPKAVLVDLDGTLLDHGGQDAAVEEVCASVARAHLGLDPHELLEANARAWTALWREVEQLCRLGQMGGYAASREAWRRTLEECGCTEDLVLEFAFAEHQRLTRSAFRPYPDVQAFLEHAAASGIPLAVVTNGPSDLQRDKVNAIGALGLVKAIVISGEHGVAKPDPAIFQLALDELGVDPKDAWCVGDSLATDVAGAHRAGITAVWLNRPEHEVESLAVPPRIEGLFRVLRGSITSTPVIEGSTLEVGSLSSLVQLFEGLVA
jgi:HAD superfamily hydrolase (TIGR01549 family)